MAARLAPKAEQQKQVHSPVSISDERLMVESELRQISLYVTVFVFTHSNTYACAPLLRPRHAHNWIADKDDDDEDGGDDGSHAADHGKAIE